MLSLGLLEDISCHQLWNFNVA